ncbi:MAG: YicC family protein, partial [Clostridia bacterium]|nr:YicC family protein [Clostridia bacterium]
GYGKAIKELDGRTLTIELKSVNNRFLDINNKMPKILLFAEDRLRKEIQAAISRGRVDVFISYVDNRETEKKVVVDLGLAKGYFEAGNVLNSSLSLTNDMSTTTFFRLPDVVKPMQEDDDSELLLELVASTVKEALQNMNKMRAIEGEKLKADILSRVEVLKGYLKKVEERAPMVVANYREKLQLRMTEILGKVEVDEAKLLNEVAFFTDKANVDEEITRLKSHFVQAENILNKEQLVGRKLDFLVQEFNRETNTICSKSNDLELTNVALLMKSEIEKIREQIQNLE